MIETPTGIWTGSGRRVARVGALRLIAAAACLGLLAPAAMASVTWTNSTTTNGLGSNNVTGVYASSSTIYAATGGGGVSVSTNNGTNWTNYTTANGLGDNYVYGVFAIGSTIYAATWGGVSIGVTAAVVPGTGLAGLAMLGFAGSRRRR